MPTISVDYCDNCNKELDDNKIFVYSISYWSKSKHTTCTKDYLFDNDTALMVCSQECLGGILAILINE